MSKPIRYCAACLDRTDAEYCGLCTAKIYRSEANYAEILELRAREARLRETEAKCG